MIFLVIVHVHESPHDSLRVFPEKIIPILNKNIITANTRIVKNIVTIRMSKFKLILSES